MTRRGFFGWLTAAVAWWKGIKQPETVTFRWKTTNNLMTGTATVDAIHRPVLVPGTAIQVTAGQMEFDAVVTEVC